MSLRQSIQAWPAPQTGAQTNVGWDQRGRLGDRAPAHHFSMLLLAAAAVFFATPAFAQVTLAHKTEAGTQFKDREKQSVVQVLTLGGMNLNTTVATEIVSNIQYDELNADGNQPIQTTAESMLVEMELPGGVKLKFDSAKPDVKSPDPNYEIVLDIFRKLSGMTLTRIVNSEGMVLSVEGIREGTQVDPEDLKAEYHRIRAMFPTEPVKEGDTWEREEVQPLGQGQMFTIKRTYQYHGTVPEFSTVKDSRKLDKITATDTSVVYSIRKGAAFPATATKSDLKVVLSEHTLLFDRNLGRAVKSSGELAVKGAIGLSIMGQNVDGTLDLTLKSKREEIK